MAGRVVEPVGLVAHEGAHDVPRIVDQPLAAVARQHEAGTVVGHVDVVVFGGIDDVCRRVDKSVFPLVDHHPVSALVRGPYLVERGLDYPSSLGIDEAAFARGVGHGAVALVEEVVGVGIARYGQVVLEGDNHLVTGIDEPDFPLVHYGGQSLGEYPCQRVLCRYDYAAGIDVQETPFA